MQSNNAGNVSKERIKEKRRKKRKKKKKIKSKKKKKWKTKEEGWVARFGELWSYAGLTRLLLVHSSSSDSARISILSPWIRALVFPRACTHRWVTFLAYASARYTLATCASVNARTFANRCVHDSRGQKSVLRGKPMENRESSTTNNTV